MGQKFGSAGCNDRTLVTASKYGRSQNCLQGDNISHASLCSMSCKFNSGENTPVGSIDNIRTSLVMAWYLLFKKDFGHYIFDLNRRSKVQKVNCIRK